jgi:hypothetical protein
VPLGYDIYPDIGVRYIRGQGVITQHERIRALVAWLRDPQYERCTHALMDFAGTQSTPRVRDLRELLTILSQHMPAQGPGWVAVVTSRPITFVMARMFEHLVRSEELPFEVKVFMSLDRAWTWLRPGEPPFQPH